MLEYYGKMTKLLEQMAISTPWFLEAHEGFNDGCGHCGVPLPEEFYDRPSEEYLLDPAHHEIECPWAQIRAFYLEVIHA